MISTTTKKNTLRGLKIGDVVLCTNGKEYEFVRLKQSKFIGKSAGATYDIPVEMFTEVVRRTEKIAFDVTRLQEGELFYTLDNKQTATIYRFKYMINADKVMAENPVTRTGVRMPASMVEGSIKELQLKS